MSRSNQRRVGFDVGTVRIGVATCDIDAILASPQSAISGGEGSITAAVSIINEYEPCEIVVGLPSNLRGADTASTHTARDWARQLEQNTSIPIILVDERLTTVQASSALRAGGHNSRQMRSKVDSAAAAIFLQSYVDTLIRTKGPLE
ncbi:MAG: Holliday junction resolvase RuvX [Candidatus Nanopelagicales bacterium]|jgi:putative holliday junction resolvase|nr:Holliday junction resolvase RuvX [Actinomycetota bacterium]MDC1474413.1 Holliday junction resolvase RuvX [Candidatus Nanopelagicales bacterium]MBT5182854.1 Holliday junction resolvase RuvX [Actinomycetota bacterium]MBT5500839.1 Holliday junction resolvase RuvX [Actinomycetota bacterium]MBT5805771.1 Holliday junction resolvase RuvX [Actinomycetota bacterium]